MVIDSVFLPPYKLGAVFAGVVTKAQNCFLCLLESRLVCEGVLEGGVSLQKVTPSDHLYLDHFSVCGSLHMYIPDMYPTYFTG